MVKCKNCGRENDDSFKFCLDCGAVLHTEVAGEAVPAPDAQAHAKPVSPTSAKPVVTIPKTGGIPVTPPRRPPTSVSPAAAPAPPSPAPVEPPPAAAEAGTCSKCDTPAKAGDAFCSNCGQRLTGEPTHGQTMYMHTVAPDTVQKPRARLVLIKPDGSEGTVFSLAAEKTTIGRSQGVIMFPKDSFISPRHAEILFQDGKLTIEDLESLNGVYWKMTAETQIVPGTSFRVGRQLLRLEVPGDFQPLPGAPAPADDSVFWGSPVPQVWARLVQILEGGKIGEIHLLSQAEVLMGREDGEVRFPEDGFISSRHCLLINRGGDCFLRDLGSANGTYLRIQKTHPLMHADRIQIGNQVLKVDLS